MHTKHFGGPPQRVIAVPKEKAKGHPDIHGPFICQQCYFREFHHSDWLPSDIWIKRNLGCGRFEWTELAGHLPAAMPFDELSGDKQLFLMHEATSVSIKERYDADRRLYRKIIDFWSERGDYSYRLRLEPPPKKGFLFP